VSWTRLGSCRLGGFDLGEEVITALGLIIRPIDKERTRGGDVGFRLAQKGRVGVQPIPREGEVGDIPLEPCPIKWRVRSVVQCLAGPIALSRGVECWQIIGDVAKVALGEGEVTLGSRPGELVGFDVLQGQGGPQGVHGFGQC
jgi:hypothetical protein